MVYISGIFKKAVPVVCVLLSACTIKYYDTEKLINDYKTEGFLDQDHYQVIVRGTPDAEARGLVFRRRSALNDAKNKIEKTVTDSLVNYNLNYHLKDSGIKKEDIINLPEAKNGITDELKEYLRYGYNAFEYYNEDNSCVIVYRIYKEDLVDSIESEKPDLKLKAEEIKDTAQKDNQLEDNKKVKN